MSLQKEGEIEFRQVNKKKNKKKKVSQRLTAAGVTTWGVLCTEIWAAGTGGVIRI